MEQAQAVDVDRTVVHPDALADAGDSGHLLEAEDGLVEQIEYVANFPGPFEVRCCYRLTTGTLFAEFAWPATASTQSEVVMTARTNAWINTAR